MPHATPLVQPVPGMPAAIYIRVSTPRQKEEGYSLTTQLPACLAYAKEYQFPVKDEHIFVDDMTGTTADRPGMLELRDLVHQQLIKLVIVYKIDRFMRDFAYQLMMIKEFGHYGVLVLDTTCPPMAPTLERTLLQHLLGAIAQFEHGQILERTERGRRGRAEAGHPNPYSPLGYRYVTTGKKTGYYEIDPEEATLVLQMFQWYAHEGLFLREIARRLNRQQVPTPQMRRSIQRHGAAPTRFWQNSTLYNILTNTDYLGTQHYGKTMNLAGMDPRKKTRHQATDPATWTPIVIPALVPRTLFDAVAQRMALNAAQNPRRRKRDYLLIGGRLRCDVCGHAMTGFMYHNTQPAYRCLQSYDGERRRWCRWIREDRVAPQIWESVCHLVRHPEELTKLMDAYRQTVGPAQIAQDRDTLQQDLRKAQRALERLVDLYVNEEVKRDTYNKKRTELERDAALYQTQLTALDAQEQALAAEATERAELAEVLQVVNELLDEATTIPAQQRILDMMGVKVFYTPQKHFRIEVVLNQHRPLVMPDGLFHSNALRYVETRYTTPGTVTLTWTIAA